jgi:hypothetical protein
MSVAIPSPTFIPSCLSANLFHLVAACTTWASTGWRSWSFETWNWMGPREPSRSRKSLMPLEASTMSGTSTLIRFSSRQRWSSMYRLTFVMASCVSFGPRRDS